MMPKVKTTLTAKIPCLLQDFSKEFMEGATTNYIANCAVVRFLAANTY